MWLPEAKRWIELEIIADEYGVFWKGVINTLCN
jgi:hypothetical protein